MKIGSRTQSAPPRNRRAWAAFAICAVLLAPNRPATSEETGQPAQTVQPEQPAPRKHSPSSFEKAIVKIYVTTQRPDYTMPWQATRPSNATGSGFLIGDRKFLTNAHIVSDAISIQVQKEGDPRRITATVAFAGHDCDLALLDVDDESFLEGMTPLPLAETIPDLSDEIAVVGYPLGGDRLSLTRGVVSRIDYSAYSHSGIDQHLVLQVDAAINPGNSGGPVLFNDHVVGLAFQGILWAENIGYAIPIPVIKRFLADIRDGTYHGYPELGAAYIGTLNPALRASLQLPDNRTGVAIYWLDPFACGHAALRPRDVLLAIDGFKLDNEGMIDLDGNHVLFAELLERKQWNDSITLTVWRQAAEQTLSIPLRAKPDPFLFRKSYDTRPQFVVRAGLVFCVLSSEYLDLAASAPSSPNTTTLNYYAQDAKKDGLYHDFDEFVVLTRRLPHPVNSYAEPFINGLVTEVNGRPIRNIRDLASAFSKPQGAFHVLRFAGADDLLVIDAERAANAQPEISAVYGLPATEYLEPANP